MPRNAGRSDRSSGAPPQQRGGRGKGNGGAGNGGGGTVAQLLRALLNEQGGQGQGGNQNQGGQRQGGQRQGGQRQGGQRKGGQRNGGQRQSGQQQQPQQRAPNVPDPSQRTARPAADGRSYLQAAGSAPGPVAPSGNSGQGGAVPTGNAPPAAAPAGDAATGPHPTVRDAERTEELRQCLRAKRDVLAAYLKGNANPAAVVVQALEAEIATAKLAVDESKPLDDLLALEKRILKQREADLKKKTEEATRRWILVPKAAEFARQGDASVEAADALVAESIARIAELSEAAGKPPPPTKLQEAVAAAQQLQLQFASLPSQQSESLEGVAVLLASLQATVASAAGDDAMGDATQAATPSAPSPQTPHAADTHGAAVPSGNAAPEVVVTDNGTPGSTTPTEPARAVDPSGDAVLSTPASPEPVPVGEGGQQSSAISATPADTELVAQATVLSQPVQYDVPQLAEARTALGARLANPPVDFDAVRRGIQQVQDAMAKQAEADDLPPRAKNRRPAGEDAADGDADDL